MEIKKREPPVSKELPVSKEPARARPEDHDIILALLRYEHRCTEKIGAKFELLTMDQLTRQFPIGHGTLHASLYHLITVAEKWTDRSRLDPTNVIGKTYPGPGNISVSELRRRYRMAAKQMLKNIAALNATEPDSRDVYWFIKRNHLVHITTHGMHHRAQMINMLKQIGVKNLIEGGDFGGWANRPLKNTKSKPNQI
jgi:uncharacterized damage-inducible protein DinB